MSQFFRDSSGILPPPPSIPTQFNTQNGNAVPAANILIINGLDSPENNDNGIITKGGVTGTGTSNEVDVVITNRATGQLTTNDATPTTIITLPLADNTVYTITGYATLRVPSTGDGASYYFDAAFRRSGGGGAVEIGTEYPTNFEDASLVNADITLSASGNNVIFQVIGVAALTIDWDGYLTYRQVS